MLVKKAKQTFMKYDAVDEILNKLDRPAFYRS